MRLIWNRVRLGHFQGFTDDGRLAARVDTLIGTGPDKRGWTVTLVEQQAELFDTFPKYEEAQAAAEAALNDNSPDAESTSSHRDKVLDD